jgi:hypothetical protein
VSEEITPQSLRAGLENVRVIPVHRSRRADVLELEADAIQTAYEALYEVQDALSTPAQSIAKVSLQMLEIELGKKRQQAVLLRGV